MLRLGLTELLSFIFHFQPLNNVQEDKMTNIKLDNGPVDFTKDMEHQGLTKKAKKAKTNQRRCKMWSICRNLNLSGKSENKATLDFYYSPYDLLLFTVTFFK